MLQIPDERKCAHVCVGVCTFRRPEMLTACIESLMLQMVSNDLHVEIVVVDNEARPNNRGIVKSLSQRSPLPIKYIHEPRRGIAVARNRVIDTALGRKCDWIAFIDDDEVADPYWILELMAPVYRDVEVLAGRHDFVLPDPLPFWVLPPAPPRKQEGRRFPTATTGNVRFSAILLRCGLRFDERLKLMGGEDNEFFARAHKMGFAIARTDRAITRETAHPERLTYRGQVYRAYWTAASDMRRLAIHYGWPQAVASKLPSILFRSLTGALELVASPLFIVGGTTAFKRRALHGGRAIGKSAGRIMAMLGHLPQPYRTVHGS